MWFLNKMELSLTLDNSLNFNKRLHIPQNETFSIQERFNKLIRGSCKILSLGSDYFSATFYQTYFLGPINTGIGGSEIFYITNLQSIPPLLKHIFVTFLPSREKQINSLLLVSVGDTDK